MSWKCDPVRRGRADGDEVGQIGVAEPDLP